MVNMNNICIFEGRMTSNQQVSQFNTSQGPMERLTFTLSVPRNLTTAQKASKKAGEEIKSTDFIRFTAFGAKAKFIQDYFPAGTPMKVFARYSEWSTTDAVTGEKKYGHNFEVEEVSFVISPSQDNGQYQQNQQNNNYSAPAKQPQAQSNFALFDDENDVPF